MKGRKKMGLFSKKEMKCEICGKEESSLFGPSKKFDGEHVCKECMDKYQLDGYLYQLQHCSGKKLIEIMEHRKAILDKYRPEHPVTDEELKDFGENYKSKAPEECRAFADRILKSYVMTMTGYSFGPGFVILGNINNYGIVIDKEDIFAGGYAKNSFDNNEKVELLVCRCFTKDPYVKCFDFPTGGVKGFFEISKSKEGRRMAEAEIMSVSGEKLLYPVTELKELKKTLKSEGSVREKAMGVNDMLKSVGEAPIVTEKDAYNRDGEINGVMRRIISEFGYIPYEDVEKALRLNKINQGVFWKEYGLDSLKA